VRPALPLITETPEPGTAYTRLFWAAGLPRFQSDPQQRLHSPSVAAKGVKTPHSVDASFNMDSAYSPRNGALNALADE
jgi:hypothetical protein